MGRTGVERWRGLPGPRWKQGRLAEAAVTEAPQPRAVRWWSVGGGVRRPGPLPCTAAPHLVGAQLAHGACRLCAKGLVPAVCEGFGGFGEEQVALDRFAAEGGRLLGCCQRGGRPWTLCSRSGSQLHNRSRRVPAGAARAAHAASAQRARRRDPYDNLPSFRTNAGRHCCWRQRGHHQTATRRCDCSVDFPPKAQRPHQTSVRVRSGDMGAGVARSTVAQPCARPSATAKLPNGSRCHHTDPVHSRTRPAGLLLEQGPLPPPPPPPPPAHPAGTRWHMEESCARARPHAALPRALQPRKRARR